MPEGEGKPSPQIAEKRPRIEESRFGAFFAKLRKRRIIETLAAFIGGGWLLVEVVERLLVNHYEFPEKLIDLTVVSVIGALLSTLVWRWFGGMEKRSGNIKVEILFVPIILLVTVAIDLAIFLKIIDIPGKTLLMAAVALCLGIVWVILKLSQWASAMPESRAKEVLDASLIAARPEKSIVVLPFANLSPDPDNAYFADGLTEELIADLSRVKALRVISRTSAMQFKGTTKGIPEIARELRVGHVLEGSVRKAGNSLRITAQLIEATTDAHLWSEKYTGTLDDVFELQGHLSRKIVEALKGKFTPDDERRLAAHATEDPRIYEVWLRARQEAWQLTSEGVMKAIRLTDQALETFGDDAMLHAANGIFNYFAYDFGFSHSEQTLAQIDVSASRALEMNPDVALAWYSKGLVMYKRGDMLGFVKCLRQALERERSGDTLGWLGFVLAEVGRMDEARSYADEALDRDPLTGMIPFSRSIVDLFDGQFDVAVARFKNWGAKEMMELAFSQWWIGQACAYAGKEDEAISEFEKGAQSGPGLFSEFCEMGVRSFRGERENTRAWFESKENLQRGANSDETFPQYLATCFARLGEIDLALRWLQRAISWGFTNHRFLSAHNRYLAPMRNDPRFQALLELAKEKAKAFEV